VDYVLSLLVRRPHNRDVPHEHPRAGEGDAEVVEEPIVTMTFPGAVAEVPVGLHLALYLLAVEQTEIGEVEEPKLTKGNNDPKLQGFG
jgi:hypothetical protein